MKALAREYRVTAAFLGAIVTLIVLSLFSLLLYNS